jgi:hypothetical protein|uniref:Uncharacterized protein n=1 Tax=viral metagenome TaxID=1070528 RepID=A0A6C0IPX2_9ZZZZ
MNSNYKTTEKQNHYLNMLKFYKQKYSTKQKFNSNSNSNTNTNTNTNSNSNLNIDKRGTKRKFSEAFL